MDQSRSSTPPSAAAESSAAVAADGGRPEHSAVSPVRRGFASFAASLQQGFGNFKALVVGQVHSFAFYILTYERTHGLVPMLQMNQVICELFEAQFVKGSFKFNLSTN